MAVHILGIRHHGPGSARNVKAFLETVRPDIVLVEGPPEADAMLQWVSNEGLKPPVALLCYQPDDPQRSVFYPFADFSPEWQAILYARRQNIHVRFMDLPAGNQMLVEKELKVVEQQQEPDTVHINGEAQSLEQLYKSPISYLADAAGFADDEKWWEHTFEYRHNNDEVFDAVSEAMQALRESFPKKDKKLEQMREAYMRRTIRQAEKEMFHTIAVICGAWHAPALQGKSSQKDDNEILKGLPKVKTECTWIPWTFNRLSFRSGYGAGINSPGWYNHIWNHPHDDGTLWMAKVAQLFRKQQMDTSVAHIIEAVRLAGALASLRGLPKVGLEELNEATLSVLCNGESILLKLVHDELIVGHQIGEVPVEIPKPPLQLDIEKQQKKLRLPATANYKDYTLDLRKDTDLERSIFLHRLQLLGINWGRQQYTSGKGTFKEQWRLQWDPGYSVEIIERGNLGNTVAEAAANSVLNQAKEARELKVIGDLLEKTIPAELPGAIEALISQLNNLAAASADVIELMEVVPGLITVARYGNVRKTDAELVISIINSIITRVCISLPNACIAIDEDASQKLLELFFKLNDGINLLQDTGIINMWQQTLLTIAANKNTSPVIGGYSTRLLHDARKLEGDQLMQYFSFAMSSATAPVIAAAWLEGFLKGSGTLLLLDQDLWQLIDNWVASLADEVFMQVLPLLRRTFANFTNPERRKLGEKARSGGGTGHQHTNISANFDAERAKQGLPVIMQLLGLTININDTNGN
ncbi:hypothetical protein DIU31_014915 [Mucilaginibacter rubeus]|uniref:Uncharacterized protein n=1 Tax=Mucilaginibacter rubeus TaxID=2027860 RepID=A0AAE6JG07_9SPHI|nr:MULTISPECIES: DUF5682 family protein [Mucilaginibacter]QEM04741.1 hypothetical protein DIU31_014915 [Mucilaginibacter rubeus]QEM17335.1 hypothetical protein DIU38_015075 [Mucilaginibacter gossypii]QTE46150.1 hypothetical protein J3L19_12610 [Mucilaginibacter rubeus]QTE52748.1 hypothetical protein J3L21_12585 [Mucilaginibacter rubeus]QTE57835.1 hypothetical protein J3L23_04260 [Mucilaginibacter rubeus]